MSVTTLILEMIVIFSMIAVGFFLRRSGHMADSTIQTVSFIISFVTNPALILEVSLSYEGMLPVHTFLISFCWSLAIYIVLIILSYLVPFLLRIPRNERYVYMMLMVYGNTGFIGIPVCRALFGNESLVFITINNILFNFLIYIYGTSILRKAKRLQDQQDGISAVSKEDVSFFTRMKPIFNSGTIASFIAIFIYLFDPQVPDFMMDIFTYVGEPTIFLSLMVLGCSVASAPLKSFITGDKKMYIFLALRMLVIPILITMVLKRCITTEPILLGSLMILVSVPGGNMPLILSREMGLKDFELSRGIILSTILCIVTIPIVSIFL